MNRPKEAPQWVIHTPEGDQTLGVVPPEQLVAGFRNPEDEQDIIQDWLMTVHSLGGFQLAVTGLEALAEAGISQAKLESLQARTDVEWYLSLLTVARAFNKSSHGVEDITRLKGGLGMTTWLKGER